MSTARIAGTHISGACVEADQLALDLMDGRAISAPLAWSPRLANATPTQREAFEVAGGGDGLHWPGIDEDLSRPRPRGVPFPRTNY